MNELPLNHSESVASWLHPAPYGWETLAHLALEEDIGTGDLSAACFDSEQISRFFIETQEEGVISGLGVAAYIFEEVGEVHVSATDGQRVGAGTRVLTVEGQAGLLLSRERTALNFLMHLSGVATLTSSYVRIVSGTRAKILDTRKTLPGLRTMQKYAVRCGGGQNHRMGLYDAPMLKDNHIAACGGIERAVLHLRTRIPHTSRIEVECESRDQVAEAVSAGADIILLDNMKCELMAAIVEEFGSKVLLEASGGINLGTVRAVAETGVDYISVGALTHSAVALNFHMEPC